jgi:hypothetical protein
MLVRCRGSVRGFHHVCACTALLLRLHRMQRSSSLQRVRGELCVTGAPCMLRWRAQCRPAHYCLGGEELPCTQGWVQQAFGQTRCEQCGSGRYSQAGVVCATCEPGSTSSPGASACTLCGAGTYASDWGSPSCTPCPELHYGPLAGAIRCPACPNGWYQNETYVTQAACCLAGPRAVAV